MVITLAVMVTISPTKTLVAQEVGMAVKIDRSVFSGPVGTSWLPGLTKAIQKAGYNCPQANKVSHLGRGAFGEEYRVYCSGGKNLIHVISLGPGDDEIVVEPLSEDAFKSTK